MQAAESSDRTPHILAVIFAIWFAFLAIRYHESFPAGTLPGMGLILFTALLILAGAQSLGVPLLEILVGGRVPAPLSWLLALGIGLGAVQMLMFAALAVGGVHPAVGWVILSGTLLVGARRLAAWIESLPRDEPGEVRRMWMDVRARWWAAPVLGIAAVGWAAALGAALAPAEFYDALIYHLAVPDHYLAGGGMGSIPGNFYAHFPAGQGMLYALGMMLAGERIDAGSLAQVLHLLMGLGAVLITLVAGLRHLSTAVGLLGAVLLATVPGILLVSTYPIADLAVTFFGALTLAALLEARAGSGAGGRWILLAGIFGGFALGVKYIAALSVCLPAAVWLGWRARRLEPPRMKELVVFLLTVSALFAPWAARNMAVTGNPVSPYLASVFGAPASAPGLGDELSRRLPDEAGAAAVAGHFLSGPWRAGLERMGAGGYLGVALVLLIPFIFLKRGHPPAVTLLAVTGITAVVAWATTVQVTRYLFPALPALALLAAQGAATLMRKAPLLRAPLAAGLGWLLLHNIYLFGVLAVTMNPYGVAFGVEMPEDYLARRVSYYPAAAFINSQVPWGAKILLIGEGRGYYLERTYDANTPFDRILVQPMAERAARENRSLAGVLREAGYTHLLVSAPEMERISRLTGRSDYFGEFEPPARATVVSLLRGEGTRTLFEQRGVGVMEIIDR
jgi:hypothetical protein